VGRINLGWPMFLVMFCLLGEVFIHNNKLKPQASLTKPNMQKQSNNPEDRFFPMIMLFFGQYHQIPKPYISVVLVAHTRYEGYPRRTGSYRHMWGETVCSSFQRLISSPILPCHNLQSCRHTRFLRRPSQRFLQVERGFSCCYDLFP
jgi:hypothetical protein